MLLMADSVPQRWRDAAIAAALALLPFLVFIRPALMLSVFYKLDVQHYFYPYHVMPARQIAQGHAPLWNPYTFSGIPLLGDGQTALFYPPNWLFFVLPGGLALTYAVLLQFSIAGVGMLLFLRQVGLWRGPAVLGALSYMFGGFMVARVVHLSIMSGAALIPLLFFCLDRAFHTQRLRWFGLAGAAVALQTVAGHPQVPIYTALGAGLFALVRAAERQTTTGQWRWYGLFLLQLGGIYLFGYMLAAAQLVPWVELAQLSPRAAGADFDFVFGGSMNGSEWLLFLFPFLYGTISLNMYGDTLMRLPLAVQTWEHSAYVGILPLGLAIVGLMGLFRRAERANYQRRFTLLFCLILFLISVIMAAGKYTPVGNLIYITPVVGKLRDVERVIVLAAFALATLAAFGLQYLAERPRGSGRVEALIAAVALAVVPLGVVLFSGEPFVQTLFELQAPATDNLSLYKPNGYVPVGFGFAGAMLLAWAARHVAGKGVQVAALLVVLLDVGSYAALFNPTATPQIYEREPAVLGPLRADPSLFRKATFLLDNDMDIELSKETLAVSWSMVYDIADINGFNSLQPRRYTDYMFGPGVGDVSYGYMRDERLLQPDSPQLSSLNVKYLLVPHYLDPQLGSNFRQVYTNESVRVYENSNVYPRAFFPQNVRSEIDARSVLATVTAAGFDGRQQALVEAALPSLPSPPTAPADVEIVNYTPNRIVLTTNTGEDRLLMLSEMYFPGWRATIDSNETTIYRANYLFRSVIVPPGQHTVEFVYQPMSVTIGLTISGIALVLLVVALVIDRRRSA